MNYTKLSNEELSNEYNEIVEQWEKDNTIFSLTDLTDIVREMTIRENK